MVHNGFSKIIAVGLKLFLLSLSNINFKQLLMKSNALLLMMTLGFSLTSFAQKIVELKSAPATIKWDKPESTYFSPSSKDSIVANVSTASLTVYLPKASKANSTALIIAPGGGFHLLAIDNEGKDLSKWCTENGIAAFVLKYRLLPTVKDAVAEFFEKIRNQNQMEKEMALVIVLAKADGLAAIEYVRKNAKLYNIKPDRIGIIGF